MQDPAPYAGLTPDVVLDALDSVGVSGDGRLLALNSYENRVYQVALEGEPPCVAKFYRPNRWTDAQILERFEKRVDARFLGGVGDQRCSRLVSLRPDGAVRFTPASEPIWTANAGKRHEAARLTADLRKTAQEEQPARPTR